MSSFVIAKEDYIKAAGIIAGMASASRDEIWIYNYTAGRNSNAQDYYDRFAEFYTMNALSVAEQYNDPTPDTDAAEYKPTFKKAMEKGSRLFLLGGDDLKNAIMELRRFFQSCIYQTENESYANMMRYFFYQITDQLIDYLYRPTKDLRSWGSLEI